MNLLPLIHQSVTAPRLAAARLFGMDIPQQAIWLGFAFVVVANTLLQALYGMLVPVPEGLEPFVITPFSFAIIFAATLILSVIALSMIGRMFGGKSDQSQILLILVWLQFLRALAQVVLMVIALILPSLSLIAVLGVSLLGVWLLMNFLDVSLGLSNLFKSFGVICFSGLFVMVGLSLLMTLILPLL